MYAGVAYGTRPYADGAGASSTGTPVAPPHDQLHGIVLEGTAYLEVTLPVATVPAGIALGEDYDVAYAYPTPTLVDGRPT